MQAEVSQCFRWSSISPDIRSSKAGSPGIERSSFAQAPRSINLHRREQKGRKVFSFFHSTSLPHFGHFTVVGIELVNRKVVRLPAGSRDITVRLREVWERQESALSASQHLNHPAGRMTRYRAERGRHHRRTDSR